VNEKTTEEIVRELREGQHREVNYRLLFDRYYDQLYRFLLRKGANPEDCLDLIQDVFVSVFKGLDKLRDETQFQSWLFRIAHNNYQNYIEYKQARKRSAREVSLDEQAKGSGRRSGPHDDDSPIDELLERERRQKLSEALQHLPPQMKRCVELRVIGCLSNPEIALALGISVNTVKAHLHQAKALLRNKLSEHFTELKL